MDLDQAHLVQIDFENYNNIAAVIFQFSLMDPDPHLECGPGSKRENDCGSGSIAQVLASALPLVYQQVLCLFHKFLGLL